MSEKRRKIKKEKRKRERKKFSISFQGPKFLNSLSFEIQKSNKYKAKSIPLIFFLYLCFSFSVFYP